jgi:hypothetical protein
MEFESKVLDDNSLSELLRDERYFFESYKRIEQFLLLTRDEKVWKNFKLIDASFSFENSKEIYSTLFYPMIDFLQVEIKFIQWILCPVEGMIIELENHCDLTLESISILRSRLSKEESENKVISFLSLDYLLIESEISLLQAIVDLKRGNFMSSSHKFLKSYQKMNEANKLNEGRNDDFLQKKSKYETAFFLRMCEHRKSKCNKKMLNSLIKIIQEKSNEIKNYENHQEENSLCSSDQTLQSTRDLLHLKQLYRELSTEYQSMNEERRLFEMELSKQSTKKATSSKASTSTTVSTTDDEQSQISNNDENQHPNQLRKGKSLTLKKPSMTSSTANKFSWNISSVSEIIVNTVDKLINQPGQVISTTESKKDGNDNLVNSLMSPKKVEMPTVSVLLPRISDVTTKLFDIDGSNGIDIKRRKSLTESSGNSSFQRKLDHLDLAQQQQQQMKRGKQSSSTSSASQNSFQFHHDFDYSSYWEAFQNDTFEQRFIQFKSRIDFIESIFSIGLSLLPKTSQWVLEIIKIDNTMNLQKAITSLYRLHCFEDCRWNKFATLALVNLPKE